MNKLDDILERLQKEAPQLPDPDGMTDSIIDMLPEIEPRRPSIRESRWFIWTRNVSSIAASLLIALYLWQNFSFNSPMEEQDDPHYISQTQSYVRQWLDDSKSPQEAYKAYLDHQRKSMIIIEQLKRKHYEYQ